MIIDARVHLGLSLFGYGTTVEEILAEMDRLHIAVAVLVPVKPRAYHLAPANDLVASAVSRHPDRLVGLCRVDPWQGTQAVDEVQRGFAELGARGLYLDPWEEVFQINDKVVNPCVEEAKRYGRPVVINAGHVRVSHPTQVRDLACRYPDVRFVACNGGQINIGGILLAEGKRMLRSCPNITIETAGTYREDYLEEVVAEIGEDRVIFASGSPIFHQEFEMARVRLGHFSDTQKEKLWSLNAQTLFGIPAAQVRVPTEEAPCI